jgi:hypothetical protein
MNLLYYGGLDVVRRHVEDAFMSGRRLDMSARDRRDSRWPRAYRRAAALKPVAIIIPVRTYSGAH